MESKNSLRKTGIDIVGDVPWGTHFCQFYETKQDLLDVLVPYFKAGLENNELCIWVTSEFLTTEEAKLAMQKSVPGFSNYLKKGRIEIFPHTEWYLKGGSFEMKRVLNDWVQKHDKALKTGFNGTRVSGNPFWIDNKKDWNDFASYEAEINKVINQYKLLVLCTYSLIKCGSSEIIDVISNHEFALIKRKGKWENIESSAHHKIELALRNSESRYRSYVELTGELAWTTNTKGEVEEDMPEWRKYTGQSFEEIKGRGWAEALHPDDVKRVIKIWQKAVSTKKPYEVEYRIKRFDGIYRHFLVKGVPIYSKEGEIHEWVGTCIDISKHKASEEEIIKHSRQLKVLNKSLQESLVKEKALLESLGDGVIAVDKKGKFIALNKRTEEIFGWKPEEILGKSLFKEFKLADEQGKIIPKELRPIKLALSTAQVGHGIYFLVRKNVSRIPLFVTSAPVILNNEVVGAINIYRDVSQQVVIDQAKDEFLYFASHTLRTPLSAIAWSIEKLNENNKEYSLEQKKSLDLIYDQTQRMIQLTNDLLDATRMDLGLLSYKYEETNPNVIVSNVIADLKNLIEDKKIKFKLMTDKNIDSYKDYSNALYMILHNLLANALKFTPVGGKVGLNITNTEKEITLQISDSGVGIPKSAQAKIFQKMYRAQNVKDKFEGSGLGLYITNGIIKHMGGKISVRSKPGHGSIFTVLLPLISKAIHPKEKERIYI